MSKITELIRTLAMNEWGSSQIRRLPEKPDHIRIHCPSCTHQQALLHNKLYDKSGFSYINVFMSMCARCGMVNYWAEWPTEEEQSKEIRDFCDQITRSLT